MPDLNAGQEAEAEAVTYRDYFAAHEAASELRTIAGEGVAIRVERSRYGQGFVVRQLPIELLVDTDYPRLGNSSARSYG